MTWNFTSTLQKQWKFKRWKQNYKFEPADGAVYAVISIYDLVHGTGILAIKISSTNIPCSLFSWYPRIDSGTKTTKTTEMRTCKLVWRFTIYNSSDHWICVHWAKSDSSFLCWLFVSRINYQDCDDVEDLCCWRWK